MLSKIIEFSVRNKLIVGLLVLALIGVGIYETTRLPIDAVPDITNNQVQVITIAPAYGAADIERLVTFPIEQSNSNIDGIQEIRSFSRFGLSLVTIVFREDVDLYWARQQVAERLQKIQSQIPNDIGQPEMGPITTGLGEIYQYIVRAKEGYEEKYDAIALRSIQDWIIRRQLLGVKGVADVSSLGGKLKQYEIAVHPDRLLAYNVTIPELFDAVEKNNQNTGGAYIEKGPSVLFIRSEGLLGNIEDIKNIAIKWTENGNPIFVRDVADVRISYATRYGALCYNDFGEVTGAMVLMLKGANSSEVIKNVKERIAQIQKTLPEGVVIEPFLERTKMVNSAIGTVEKNLLEGALIVIFILVLFLGSLRAGLLVASVIPLSMLFAIIMMNIFGVSGNLMSLGALDFGLIVDGAVIIVEAVLHNLVGKQKNRQSGFTQNELNEEVKHSASKMMNSAVFGQITILIVYLPIFSLQGIEGKMFKPMAQTVAFALLGAFLLSLTYIPMMSSIILSKTKAHQSGWSDKMMQKLEHFYQNTLRRIIPYPKTVILSIAILFIGALSIIPFLGGEFIPSLEEGDFAVETRLLTGSNLNTSIETSKKAAKILMSQFPEVEKVVGKIGSGEIPTDPMPMEANDLIVVLKDKKEWTSAQTFNELSDKMSEALKAIPGVSFGFQYPVQLRFNELMTGARQDVVCKIFGENLDTLAYYAQQLGSIINTVRGSNELFIEPVMGMPQIIIEYDRAALAQYHLNVEMINRVVNTAFAGQTTGLVFEDEKRYDLVVRLQDEQRKNLENVQNLLIPTPHGTQIPLYLLAKVSEVNGPNQIQREGAQRRIVVGFNVKDRDVQSIVEELQQKAETQIKLPAGYHIKYGGAFENLKEAKKRLSVAVPISLVLIFILLYFAFGSIKQGLLIYSAIPLSAIGGVYFLALRGMPFSISAGVGFIALFGVAVLNGIVLIAEFNKLKKEGYTDPKDIVLTGTQLRLRPVLMTALVASLGFLPMALSNGVGADVQRPLATVVIGGLITATLLTLFVLPILFMYSEKAKFNKNTASALILLLSIGLCLNTKSAKAQQNISLKAAIDSALVQNLYQRSTTLNVELQRHAKKTAYNLPATTLSGEYGRVNSRFIDNKIGASQSFSLPFVYAQQKNILNDQWQSALYESAENKKLLVKTVSELYYRLIFIKQKKRALITSDSLFGAFARKAKLRLQKGESNLLEKSTAEIQRQQIRVQLTLLEQAENEIKRLFSIALNTKQTYEPEEDTLSKPPQNLTANQDINLHPTVLKAEQNRLLSAHQIQLEKARLIPDLFVGYYSMTMIGTGADNIVYNSSARFNSGQLAINIPLLGGAQQAKIKAAKTQQKISELNYLQTLQEMNNKVELAYSNYAIQYKNVLDMEAELLPELIKINEAANQQINNGEINYLEWVLTINQSQIAYLNYLENLLALNESYAQIQFLSTQN